MFQLENQLREWSNRFSQTEAMRHGDVEELECHVRDSIEALTASGLDAQEAFLIATHRLGDHDALGGEYRRANCQRVLERRAFWMAAGCLLFALLRSLFGMAVSLGQVIATLAGANGTQMSFVSLGVGFAFCGLLTTYVIRWHLKNEQASSARARAVLNRNGWVIGSVLTAAVLMAKIVQTGSHVVIVRTTSIDELGRAAIVQSWSNGVLVLLVPLVILIIMLKLHRAIWHPASVMRTA